MAIKDGVQIIVATPRWNEEWDPAFLAIQLANFRQKLQQLHQDCDGQLSFKLGFLLRLSAELPQLIGRYGTELTLGGGRFLLVSLPALHLPAEAEALLASLARQGYSVVISRPECNPALRHDAARLKEWLAGGLILQLDAASITGGYGREVQRFALGCVRQYGSQTLIASNARDAGDRRPSLTMTREELVKQVGAARARHVFEATPAKVINAWQVRPGESKGDNDKTSAVRSLAAYLRLTKSAKTVSGAR